MYIKDLRISLIEESDRGCVLVAAAKIDTALEDAFAKIFSSNAIPKKVSLRIFDIGGPLATFSAKNKLAYAMGLIPKEIYSDIEMIRSLRNKFAHSIELADFDDPEVSNIVYGLNCVKPLNVIPPATKPDNTASVRLTARQEAKIVADGYVKVTTKTAFAFGISVLLHQISQSSACPNEKLGDF